MKLLLTIVGVVSLATAADGFANYQVPNLSALGSKVIGHSGPGGSVDAFGAAVKAAGQQLTTALCLEDTDNDGVANGAELGVDDCNQPLVATRTTGITNPGVADAAPPVDPPAGGDPPPGGDDPVDPPAGGDDPVTPPTDGQTPPTGGQTPPTGGQTPPTGQTPNTPDAGLPQDGAAKEFYEDPAIIGLGAAGVGIVGIALFVRQRNARRNRQAQMAPYGNNPGAMI